MVWFDGVLQTCLDGCFQNRGGPPKSSILIGFSIINHPFWGTPIFGNIHMMICVSTLRIPNFCSPCFFINVDLLPLV